jgi:hypothetical protein
MASGKSTLELPPSEQLAAADGAAARRSSRAPWLASGVATVLVAGAFAAWKLLGAEPSRAAEPAPVAAVASPASPEGTGAPRAIAPPPPTAPTGIPAESAASSTVVAGSPAVVMLDTIPSGAVVYEGTLRVGITPLELKLQSGTAATYRFALEGFRPATRTVEASEREVKVQLTRNPAPARKKVARPAGSGLKDNPYEDLKANPF